MEIIISINVQHKPEITFYFIYVNTPIILILQIDKFYQGYILILI